MMSAITLDKSEHLIDQYPTVEADLYLIIKAYEDSMKKSGTEEGILAASYGELTKAQELTSFSTDTIDSFGGMSRSEVEASIKEKNPWADCLICRNRLFDCTQHLPKPGFMSIFQDVIDSIKGLVDKFKELLDPTNTYSDICMLISGLRGLCVNDLVLMVNSLLLQISNNIFLLIKLEFDWLAIVGLILFPLGMMNLMLFDGIEAIASSPLDCIQQFMEGYGDFINNSNATKQTLEGIAPGIGVDLQFNNAIVKKDSKTTLQDKGAGFGVDAPTNSSEASTKALTSMAKSFDDLNGYLNQFNDWIKEYSAIWRNGIQTIVEMFNKNTIGKLDIGIDIIKLIRLVKMIKAVIDSINSGTLCTDLSTPLSPKDIESVLDNLPPVNNFDPNSVTNIINITLNSGTLNITDTVLDTTVVIPSCINKVPESIKDEMARWIKELNEAAP